MILDQELIDCFDDNAQTYRFLSQMLFKELTDEAIDALQGSLSEFPRDTGNDNLDGGYNLVRRYFKFSNGDRRSQLACEYARIFLAAGVYSKGASCAIPYESVFTSEEHIMMQASRNSVVRHFRQDGFQVNPDLHEPEDHLAFELEYLAVMNERAAAAAETGDIEALRANMNRQETFIREHILNWVPQLLEKALEFAKPSFYPGMLKIAIGVAEESLAAFGIARDYLRDVQREAA